MDSDEVIGDERPEGFYDMSGPGLFDGGEATATPEPIAPDADAAEPATENATAPAPKKKPAATPTKKAAATEATSSDPKPAKTTREKETGTEKSTGAEKDEPVGSAKTLTADGQPRTLALYRRYRPDSFDEVIGEEHVTEPLKRALDNDRVNHAYLFSGPRGCGKTTSARILARCLNCEQGPTSTPCGECRSCRDLSTGGPGSVDVIEIDAASHGQVDDARDLRDKVFYVPVQSRYKIYIIDEAHMVTTAGFNALLKVVEEPPPHVKFIFATTEPEKVIDTIRSRTHHYPFRLVPPKVMQSYLETICAEEGVAVEQGVLPLVVRAGAGSVRDSLSVLDQLLGAAGKDGVTYKHASMLLGYTPDWLLDELVDAFGDTDGAGVYAAIDKVIEVGLDPKRFTEDLLQRLRDLMIIARVPDAVKTGLLDLPEDQAIKYTEQASKMGPGELTRAAEVVAEGLTAMRGTTAPRLHLELMCSRVLLPSADTGPRSVLARVERLEKTVALGSTSRPGVTAPVSKPSQFAETTGAPSVAPPPPAAEQPTRRRFVAPDVTTQPPPRQRPAASPPTAQPTAAAPTSQPAPQPPPTTPAPAPVGAGTDVGSVWGQLLGAFTEKKVIRALLSQFQPVMVDGDVLVIEGQAGFVQSQGQRAADAANQVLPHITGGRVCQLRVVAIGMVTPPATASAQVPQPTPAVQKPAQPEPAPQPPVPSAAPATPPNSSNVGDEESEISDDDAAVESTDAVGLLTAAFGAEVIEEEG